MKNNNGTRIKASYFILILSILTGIFLKVNNKPGTEILLIVTAIASLLFIVLSINEINSSIRISKNEKIMWTTGVIFMSGIAGAIYLLFGRKRIVS